MIQEQESDCLWEREQKTCWCHSCEEARSAYEEYLADMYRERDR